MTDCDIAIIGAGPYGLSVAAHLGTVKGLAIKVFGEPMSFWQQHMPKGMLLRSPWAGSHLSDPDGKFTLDAFRRASGNHFSAPIPLPKFVEYGQWFRQQTTAPVDNRQVLSLEKEGASFCLTLKDGSRVMSRRVVVAAGISCFPFQPEPFQGLPGSLVSHTAEHQDLGKFKGKRVLIIGRGQSALESAVLIHEAGGDVEVLVRASTVRWLHQKRWMHAWPIQPLLYAWPDVGAAGISHLVANPNLYRRLPRSVQDRWGITSIRPAGARWVQQRFNGIPVLTDRKVASATEKGDQLKLTLDNGLERLVDHVLLGTGYKVDIARYPFLEKKLVETIDRVGGLPKLDAGFESSVPGLHFVGAPAAWSFGPLMRFVAGSDFASRALARKIRRNSR